VVAFGLGGIHTEVWHDISLRVAPIDRADAEAMIHEIESYPLLESVRGEPPRDLDALTDALVTFSQLPFRYPVIDEVDLNPVFLFAQGGGLLAGDIRVIRKEHTGRQNHCR
jgi:acetyltransferase